MAFAFTSMEQLSGDQVAMLFTNDAAGGTVNRRLSNLSADAAFTGSFFAQRAARLVATDAAARTSLLRDYQVSPLERTNVANAGVVAQYTYDAIRDAGSGDIDLQVIATAPGGAATATLIVLVTAKGGVGVN